ncbi:MAG: hypothetical protein RLZZ165_2365 [Bacteroidota bacterium]|jgi:transposase-like protein
MKAKRKRYGAAFKAQVAPRGCAGAQTLPGLSSQYGVHANEASEWKKRLLERSGERSKTSGTQEAGQGRPVADPYQQPGTSEMEREFRQNP